MIGGMAEVEATEPGSTAYAALAQTQEWGAGAGGPLSQPDFDRVGAARYEESAVLGVGGMGKVVLARDARVGRDVAIKVLREGREGAEMRERFLREAQVQGQLEHPAIVPVYDIERRADGSTFFTMRRVLGRSLAEIVRDARSGSKAFGRRQLLEAFATVCLAIDYAHSRGVIHRDLKPANVMLGNFGEVYVLDWGIARVIESGAAAVPPASRLSQPGLVMGTPLYMAPEQMLDPDVGVAADLFALGAMLFELLTFVPLRDPSAIEGPIDARASVRAPERDVAVELEAICVRATAASPEARYGSARALQEDVAKYLDGELDLDRRRVAAAEHVGAAREALDRAKAQDSEYEVERGVAMRELVRALALEPTNQEHVALLAATLEHAPTTVPVEVKQQVDAQGHEVVRSGVKFSALAMAGWFLALPVILLIGVRRADYLAVIVCAAAATGLVAFVAGRRANVGRVAQGVVVVTAAIASVALSRLVGPLVLVPTLCTTWTIVSQLHPDRVMRRFMLVAFACVPIVTIGLELGGVLPPSYAFGASGMVVLPQLTDLPEVPVTALLSVANFLLALMPAVFVGVMRDQLTDAQTQQAVQTWHFRRLGDDLIRASTSRPHLVNRATPAATVA